MNSPIPNHSEKTHIACFDTRYRYLFFDDTHQSIIEQVWGSSIAPGVNVLECKPDNHDIFLLKDSLDKAMSGEFFIEKHHHSKKPEQIWESTYSPMYDAGRKICGVSVTTVNITERELAEKSLSEQQKKYQYIFNNMSLGIALCQIIYDENGNPCDYKNLEVNKAYEEQSGIKASDITGKTILEFYPDIEKSWIEICGEVALTKKPRTFIEFNHNTNKYYEASAFSLGEDQFALLFKDITARKRDEESLRRAAAVFENTAEGIIVTNAEGEIILVNRAFSTISGFSMNDILGKNPKFQQSNRHDNDFYSTIWNIIRRDGQWQGEIWNSRKDGSVYPAWENITSVKDEQGQVTNYVIIFSDISSLKESEERLHHMAHHDTLTNLPNRLRFMTNLELAMTVAKHNNHEVALIYIDLDGFKYVNDTLGHDKGDELLKIVAERLVNCVRSQDTVARLGGDEFTVVLSEIRHTEDAALIASKIVNSIKKPIFLSGNTIDISASLGIGMYPGDSCDAEGLLNAADTAMYHAKATGKNCFRLFTRELASRKVEQMLIEQGLRRAMEQQEFEVHYQPQINLSNGNIIGVEALVRWNHPQRGQLLPDTFIDIAEDMNLIDEISEWVLRTAIGDYQQWSMNKSVAPRIAINITGRQISNEKSVSSILNILDELIPEQDTIKLDFEITETALEQSDKTLELVDRLKLRGIMLIIDDFGTGHSSLFRLKELPIDALKIDRTFIADIDNQGEDKEIVAAIITMAHGLNLRVICEGVETKSQLDVLQSLGCDEVQGFYFSRPLPAVEITPLLESTYQSVP